MLSDREKLVLHFCCSMTIAKMTGVANHKAIIEKMVEDIRQNRCRSLSEEDVVNLLDEVNEEMVGGRVMFQHLTDDLAWSMTGERPKKNTNWKDMRETPNGISIPSLFLFFRLFYHLNKLLVQ